MARSRRHDTAPTIQQPLSPLGKLGLLELELAQSSDEAARANGSSAAASAAVKSAGIVKYSVTSESESELADDLELARVASQLRRGMWSRKRGRSGRGPVGIFPFNFCSSAIFDVGLKVC